MEFTVQKKGRRSSLDAMRYHLRASRGVEEHVGRESWLEQHQAHHSEQGGQVLNRRRESPRQRDGPPKGLPRKRREGPRGWNGDRVGAGSETSWCARGRGRGEGRTSAVQPAPPRPVPPSPSGHLFREEGRLAHGGVGTGSNVEDAVTHLWARQWSGGRLARTRQPL